MVLNLKNENVGSKAICAALLLLCAGLSSAAMSKGIIPDNQKALLTVQGQGVNPYAQISLSTGPQQTIVTKADADGQFAFSNLKYASFSDLKFAIDMPPFEKGLSKTYPSNHLEFSYLAKESTVRMSGGIGKYGTLALNMAGAKDGFFRVAGPEGYVMLQGRTAQSLASGQSTMVASIVNAGEVCCPKLIVPAAPITLTIFSQPMLAAASNPVPNIQPKAKPVAPTSLGPIIIPPPVQKNLDKPTQSPRTQPNMPILLYPKKDTGTDQQQTPKVKIPYIVQGKVDVDEFTIQSEDIVAATSFSSSDFDNTYVGGIKGIADETRNAVLANIAAIGAMLDGRTFMDTTRSLQVSTAQTLRNYTPSNQVCKFGTLSRSIAGADAVSKKNQLAFSKLLTDRTINKSGTVYGDPEQGVVAMLSNFKKKYCNTVDSGGGLEKYCATSTDELYNHDVDFTRVFDVPLTIDADFSDSAITNDKESVMALFEKLSFVPPAMIGGSGSNGLSDGNTLQIQDIRALNALRTVSANSFASLVAEKSKASSQSTTYLNTVLTELGLQPAEVTKLLGANPSYFAQMEVMTKKIFQNPSFYANLYDSEANVDRQRVAMKALELQQDRDFLESLRRREMMLSVLLNAKLRNEQSAANASGVVRQ